MAYSDTCALLMAARMLITDREAWTTGAFSRTATGVIRWSDSPAAIKWCLSGALEAFGEGPEEEAFLLLSHTINDFPVFFNDTHTHKEVLAALDKAIEAST